METLLIGNTGYVTKEFIHRTFPQDHVMVIGNPDLVSDERHHITSMHIPEESMFEDVFEGYGFERVVYFSNHLTFHTVREGELEKLRHVLQTCVRQKEIEVVYLTSLESCQDEETGKTVLARAAQNLCHYYAENRGLKIKTVRVPYLYSGTFSGDYFYQIFRRIDKGEELVFRENPEQKAGFLSMDDLSELLFRLFDGWEKGSEVLNAPDTFDITYGQLAQKLQEVTGAGKIRFESAAADMKQLTEDKQLRRRFGWFQHVSILMELDEMYAAYQQQKEVGKSKMERLFGWIRTKNTVVRVLELLIGFVLTEYLNHLAGNTVQFKMIDLRLLFIVVMGSMYGLNIGIAAAALESLSLVFAYKAQGVGWMTLFYEPTNWIPFIAYFVVGALCEYWRLKSQDEIKFLKREKELIQEKFFFMRQLYQDTLQDKREYKKQIIGSRDSFGKIYDVTKQLDVARPQEVFIKSISVMEEILENQSISVYSVGKNGDFARLEAVSKASRGQRKHSLDMRGFDLVQETLAKGEIWVNTELLPEFPMYIAGIRRDDKLVLMIMVYEAAYNQMGMYYQNLIKILCGLIETSMLRALSYQEAVRYEQYLEGTKIMKEEYFLETLRIRHTMLEQMIADYVLIRLDCGTMSVPAADQTLRKMVRENDVVGISDDGYLYLIASQATKESVQFVIDRLEKAGFGCRVVPQVGEE